MTPRENNNNPSVFHMLDISVVNVVTNQSLYNGQHLLLLSVQLENHLNRLTVQICLELLRQKLTGCCPLVGFQKLACEECFEL